MDEPTTSNLYEDDEVLREISHSECHASDDETVNLSESDSEFDSDFDKILKL